MRFLSAATFFVAVGVFFLPWLDVRCEMGNERSSSLLTQSGYEIASGKFSEGDVFKELEQMGGAMGKKPDQPFGKMNGGGKEGPKEAPLMYVYAGVMLAGGILSLVLVNGKVWRVCTVACMLGAGAILAIQMTDGFPVEKSIAEDEAKQKNQPQINPNIQMPMAPFGNANPKIVVKYKAGLYLALCLTALPLLWIILDAGMTKKVKPPLRSDLDFRDDDRDGKNPMLD